MLYKINLVLEFCRCMMRCYIFPILLYDWESRTLDLKTGKSYVFKTYLYWRMLCKKQNKFYIKEHKALYIGHMMRDKRYEILRLMVSGKILCLKDIKRWYGCSSTEIFRAAVSEITIVKWIVNFVHSETVDKEEDGYVLLTFLRGIQNHLLITKTVF